MPDRSQRLRMTLSLALIFFGVTGTACAPPKVELKAGLRDYQPDDYPVILRLWTREERLNTIEAMDNVLTVTSTFESLDFRSAYVTRYARDFGLSPSEKKNMLARSFQESESQHQFYVALFGTIADYGDLTRKEPAWVVRLVNSDGTETPPSDVLKIKDINSAATRAYFPYTSSFRTAFRLSFPRLAEDGHATLSEKGKWFGLKFRGPQGETTLVWEIQN